MIGIFNFGQMHYGVFQCIVPIFVNPADHLAQVGKMGGNEFFFERDDPMFNKVRESDLVFFRVIEYQNVTGMQYFSVDVQ